MPYKNTEKRKEKSRDAARSRRGKECEVFLDLANNLPMPESISGQLDKASVMRLSISFLKIWNILRSTKDNDNCIEDANKENQETSEKQTRFDHLHQKALEGFVFILSQDGDFVFLSENVVKYLGLQQIDVIGQSIFDFTHPCDHEEIRDVLTMKLSSPKSGILVENKTCFLRMKCTLTSKGRNVNLKSASYKVMKCSGRLIDIHLGEDADSRDTNWSPFPYLAGIAEPIPHPSNIEVPLDSSTFLSKHNMDMKFIFCDEKIQELAGFSSQEMIGQPFYEYHHALDTELVDKAFKDLFSKGQTTIGPYRLLNFKGGYIWITTQATVIQNSRTQKPQWVVCVHYILSGVEEEGLIMSHVQKAATKKPATNLPKLELNTEHIFAPKTKDMDKGYYVPKGMKETITYQNNEPTDLSYLAPAAGEQSIPVFGTNNQATEDCFLFSVDSKASSPYGVDEVKDSNYMSLESISPYKSDCLLSPAPIENGDIKCEPGFNPSDMIYRKGESPASLLSSNPSSRIASPNDFLIPDNVDSMDQFFQNLSAMDEMPGEGNLDDTDFLSRAPFISMDPNEDLGLMPPTSSTLISVASDVNPRVFGQTESVFTSPHTLMEEPEQPPKQSVMDMLGGSTAMASIEQPPDTMYLQLKRPLDMNSLEKGPPISKAKRVDLGAGVQSPPPLGSSVSTSKDSVLLNLLLRGEDRNYGYKVSTLQTMSPADKKPTLTRQQSGLFPTLTRFDCEVNAPAQSDHLLQGREIINALDIGFLKPPTAITPR